MDLSSFTDNPSLNRLPVTERNISNIGNRMIAYRDFVGNEHALEDVFIRCPEIEHLSVDASDLIDRSLEILLDLRNLKSLLVLKPYHLTDRAFKIISSLNGLTSLALFSLPYTVTAVGLSQLAKLSCLEYLGLRFSNHSVTDDFLMAINGLHSLQILDLGYCDKITDVGICSLRALPDLQELSIEECSLVTDKSGDAFSRFPSLRYAGARGTMIKEVFLLPGLSMPARS